MGFVDAPGCSGHPEGTFVTPQPAITTRSADHVRPNPDTSHVLFGQPSSGWRYGVRA